MSAGTNEKYLYERLLTVNPEIRVHVILYIIFSIFNYFSIQCLQVIMAIYKAILKVYYKHLYIVEPHFRHHLSWLFSLMHLLAAAVLGPQLVII